MTVVAEFIFEQSVLLINFKWTNKQVNILSSMDRWLVAMEKQFVFQAIRNTTQSQFL